jgi:MOSC domain-containing protein YiiM
MDMPVTITHIFVSPGQNFTGRWGKEPLKNPEIPQQTIEVHEGRGIVGDRYYNYKDNYKGQITFFSYEVYLELKQKFNIKLEPQQMRRNIIVSGIDLQLLIDRPFSIGKVSFVGSEHCKPCAWMDQAVGPGAHEWMKPGKGGLRARILTDGVISVGDSLTCDLVST